jgi:uncharacterized surface protein with fasciclin (FAS1) repeats
MRRTTLGLMLALAIPLAACDDDDNPVNLPEEEATPDIVEAAQAAGSFNTLVGALETTGLVETLKGDGPFTVFAPTDAAFGAFTDIELDAITSDVDLLTRILTYHVVPGDVRAADVVNLSSAPTVNGKDLSITVEGGEVFVDGRRVAQTDLVVENGVIHVLDGVLLPEPILDIVETARNAGSFNTLLAALDVAGLTDVLEGEGPFTVLAPTDDAFAKIPPDVLNGLLADVDALTDVLTYHVIDGEAPASAVVQLDAATTLQGGDVAISVGADGTVRINDSTVLLTDIMTRNGIIHVIDAVLLP